MNLINKMAGTGANCIRMSAWHPNGSDGGITENPFKVNFMNWEWGIIFFLQNVNREIKYSSKNMYK